jgi:hypothetical protein
MAQKNVILGDFAPFTVGASVPLSTVLCDSINSSTRRLLTEECVYFTLGEDCFQKVMNLKALNCSCSCGGKECEFCLNISQCSANYKVQPSDLKKAFKWIDVRKVLVNAKVGRGIDTEWINRFVSIVWEDDDIIRSMLYNRLEPYLVHHSKRSQSRHRLYNRLLQIVQYPFAFSDDDEKADETDGDSIVIIAKDDNSEG